MPGCDRDPDELIRTHPGAGAAQFVVRGDPDACGADLPFLPAAVFASPGPGAVDPLAHPVLTASAFSSHLSLRSHLGPLLQVALMAGHAAGLDLRMTGLPLRKVRWQVLVGLTGVLLGYVEYLIVF